MQTVKFFGLPQVRKTMCHVSARFAHIKALYIYIYRIYADGVYISTLNIYTEVNICIFILRLGDAKSFIQMGCIYFKMIHHR